MQSSAVRKLALSRARRGRNTVAAAADLVALVSFLTLGAYILLIQYLTWMPAAAFALALGIGAIAVRRQLWARRIERCQKRLEHELFVKHFTRELIYMDAKLLESRLAVVLAASDLSVREERGMLLVKQENGWLPAVLYRLPEGEKLERRDVWFLLTALRRDGLRGALIISTAEITREAREMASLNKHFPVEWMDMDTLCAYAANAGFRESGAGIEEEAQRQLGAEVKSGKLSVLLQKAHVRRFAYAGGMLWLLSYITAWALYYRIAAALMLVLCAASLVVGRRKTHQAKSS